MTYYPAPLAPEREEVVACALDRAELDELGPLPLAWRGLLAAAIAADARGQLQPATGRACHRHKGL